MDYMAHEVRKSSEIVWLNRLVEVSSLRTAYLSYRVIAIRPDSYEDVRL